MSLGLVLGSGVGVEGCRFMGDCSWEVQMRKNG